jgi:quercetin dioxygenase-like cupin family protein
MRIIRERSAGQRALGQEKRIDYSGDYFKMVVTHIPPGHIQNEHRHDRLSEITLVLRGTIRVAERSNGHQVGEELGEGDMVVFSPGTFHNVENATSSISTTLTLKMVAPADLSPIAFAELCQKDWLPYLQDR